MKGSGVTPELFKLRLQRGADRLDAFASRSAQSIASHIAFRAYVNSPILTGRLRSDIVATPVQKTGEGFVSIVKISDDDLFYAPLMYAFLSPFAVFPLYNLGPISRVQPSQPEGGVGGQWFVRAATYNQPAHEQKLRDGLTQLFVSGNTTPLKF